MQEIGLKWAPNSMENTIDLILDPDHSNNMGRIVGLESSSSRRCWRPPLPVPVEQKLPVLVEQKEKIVLPITQNKDQNGTVVTSVPVPPEGLHVPPPVSDHGCIPKGGDGL